MQNVIERMRAERRARMMRDALAFVGYALMMGAGLFALWAFVWAGCAVIDSCYYANI